MKYRLRRNPDGRIVIVPDTLLHGTMPRSLPSIAVKGLSAGQDKSLHNTITRNATFFTDSMMAALLYSTGAAEPEDDLIEIDASIPAAILAVKTGSLPLEPDYDDVKADLADALKTLGKEVGRKIALGEEVGEDVEKAIAEIWSESSAPLSVEHVEGKWLLYAEPVVRLPAEDPDRNEDIDIPNEIEGDGDSYWFTARQYLCRCTVLPHLIKGVFVTAPIAKRHRLQWPPSGQRVIHETLVTDSMYPEVELGYYPLSSFVR